MTNKELMVGDWVKVTDDDTDDSFIGQVKAIDELGNVNVPEGEDVAYPYSIDCLEPIPLTPEILEKNFQESLPGINLMYQLKGPYCAMNEDGQWVFGLVKVDGENSARYPLVKISFVHQLQHALRLCGIEKEIII